MPFGSFIAQPLPAADQKQKKKPAPQRSIHESRDTLRIVLIGRSLPLTQDFLCSMSQNMDQSLAAHGMTYYTRELDAISDMVARKKKMEQFFWTVSEENWMYPTDGEEEKRYTFSISPSGNQKQTLDLAFHCATPEQIQREDLLQADALWVLADGAIYGGGVSTGFELAAADILRTFSEAGRKPVCILLSQIERWGHFERVNGVTVFPRAVSRSLQESSCKTLSGGYGRERHIAVVPVQIYGGLEYIGSDEYGQPMLHITQSGFFQSYIPENCEVPGLYTLQAIRASDEALQEFPCGDLHGVIEKVFVDKYGNAGWHPVFLGEESEV